MRIMSPKKRFSRLALIRKRMEGRVGMQATTGKNSMATIGENTRQSSSDWAELRKWGSELARKAGLTKDDSRKILERVRRRNEDNP